MTDVTLDLNGMSFTLANSLPDPVTGAVDVYNATTLYAIRHAEQSGDEMKEIMDVVQRNTSDLAAVNNMANWPNTDWSNSTAGMAVTSAMVDLGLIPGDTTTGQPSFPNTAYVSTVSSSSGVPANIQVNWPPYPFNASTAPTYSTFTSLFPGDGVAVNGGQGMGTNYSLQESSDNPPIYFVVSPSPNYQCWKVDMNQTKYGYEPNGTQMSTWLADRQNLVTSIGQISQNNQLILQSKTGTYIQTMQMCTSAVEEKEHVGEGVAGNFA